MKYLFLLIATCLLLASGCATPGFLKKSGEDVGPVRGDRREQAMRQFEVHRDSAQYQAAMDRWKAGDPFTCEAQLQSLVERNPKHMQAHQALADLAMERGDTETAEQKLRELLKLAPEDAQTHHSLGMLLELKNQHEEGRQHLKRATELAPENTLYQLCVQPDASSLPVNATASR